jgi:SAM-dependent methyltransferase
VCRAPGATWLLDDSLACSNPACGERYARLTPSIPVVAAAAARKRVAVLDTPGPLPAPGGLREWMAAFGPERAEFAALSRAAIFLRAMRLGAEEPFYQDLCEALLPVIPQGAAVLDLGCGAGNLTFEVARRAAADVIGIDLDGHLLRWAERAAAGHGFEAPVRVDAARFAEGTMVIAPAVQHARFLCANLLDPPFGAESFDLVALVNVLDSVAHPAAALRQAVALLKPGGSLLFASPDSWNGGTTQVARWLATTEEGWDRTFARAGLETVKRIDDLEWRLQDSPRLHHLYRVHGRLLRKP